MRIVPSWCSLLSQRIETARIEVTGSYLSALRTCDGNLRLLPTLIGTGDASRTNAQPTANAAATPAARPPARSVSIGEIRIENGTLESFDETVAQPPWKVRLRQVEATVRDLMAPALSGQLPFEVSAELDGPQREGRVALSGMVLGVPRDLLFASLQAKGGKISLDFSLDGDINDPKFSLHEMLSTRIAVQLAKELGFSIGGLVEGVGDLGLEGIKGADKAAGGIGSALRKLIPHGR